MTSLQIHNDAVSNFKQMIIEEFNFQDLNSKSIFRSSKTTQYFMTDIYLIVFFPSGCVFVPAFRILLFHCLDFVGISAQSASPLFDFFRNFSRKRK